MVQQFATLLQIIIVVDFFIYISPFVLLKKFKSIIYFVIFFITKKNWNMTYNFAIWTNILNKPSDQI
jgi:hypothetical protein